MADQIIIELIGDPSGLKPAEDALKQLSKISEENMAAFNKANEAMKKYQEALNDVSKKASAAAEASKKLAESMKDIGQQADAIKKTASAIDDIGKKASAATEASKKIAEGMKGIGQQAESVKKTTTAIDGIGTTATKSITAISGLNGVIAAGNVKAVTADYQDWTKKVQELTTKKIDLNKKLEENRKTMAAAKATGDTTSEAYQKLITKSKSLGGEISSNNQKLEKLSAQYINTSKATTDAGSSTEKNSSKLNIFSKAIETGKEKLGGFTKKMQENAKGAADNSKKVGDLIGHTKGMVSALGEVGQAMASANGNEAAGAEIKKKTAAALQALSTAQAVVTVATEAATIATTAATIANIALDAAMFPITLTVAAIALAVGALYLAFQKLTVVKEMFAPIGIVIDFVSDKMRDFLSLISFGLVDSAAVHKHKEDIKKIGDEHENNSEKLKKQIDLLEAQGASADKIWAAKKQQLEEEKASLEAKLSLEKDEEKRKELQNKLDETSLSLAKHKTGEAEAHLATMKEEGASEEEMLKYQKEQNDKALDLNNKALAKLKLDMAIAEQNGNLTEEMKEQLKNLEHQNKVLETQHKGIMQGFDEEQKKKDDKIKDGQDKAKAAHDKAASDASDAHAKSLEDAKNTADAKLSMAEAGSKAELDAKIADINAAAAVEMNNAKDNDAQKQAITKKQLQDIAAAENAYKVKNLQDAKTDIEAQLALVKKGSGEELNLRAQFAAKERDIALAQAGLTANQKLVIEDQYQQKLQDLDKQTEQSQANVRKTEIQMELQDKKLSLDAKLKLDRESLQLEQKERIAAIKASGKSQLEIDKDIAAAEMNYNASVLAATKANIEEKLKVTLAHLEEEKTAKKLSHKEMEENFMKGITARKAAIKEMYDKGIIDKKEYDKQIKATDDEDTKHKAENAKKTQDLEKKLGQEAINMAKQVADAIFAAQAEKRKQALDDTINKLEAQKTAELSNHHLTAAQKAAIEKKYHEHEAALKLKAWKADQKAKAEQAIINGLLALTSALATVQPTMPAGIIAGALALASAGVAVGTILSKSPPKFAKGVIGLQGPGTETSDSIAAYLSKGESVITAERTNQYKPILEQIQAGIYTPLPIPMLSTLPRLHDLSGVNAQAAHARGEAIDYDKLGQAVAKALPKAKVQNLSFDKKGFSHYIISESGKLESYNNRYRD